MITASMSPRSCAVLLAALACLAPAGPEGLRAEELPVLLRTFAAVESPAPPFEGGIFLPRPGETISFIGGTDTFEQDRHGFVETRFQLAWPEHRLRLRNLAWQGDTLFHQARPLHFYTAKGDSQPGSTPDNRQRTEPGIIFICFGKMESLDDGCAPAGFLDAYRALLAGLETRSRRIVLVAPAPFFPAGAAGSLAEGRNKRLAGFVTGMRALAAERSLLFVDFFTPLLAEPDAGLSANGVHLTEKGHRAVAGLMAKQLQFPARPASPGGPAALQSLGQAIERKNRLWQQYYRPTNWAFLFGDRQHVPASRDPVDRDERWFIREIDALPALIAETEADIHRHAREAVAASLLP